MSKSNGQIDTQKPKIHDTEVRDRQLFAATFGPLPGSKWRHFRGGLYTVIDCGLDCETLEPVVMYTNDEERHYYWVRTLEDWHKLVLDDDDKEVPRFAKREE